MIISEKWAGLRVQIMGIYLVKFFLAATVHLSILGILACKFIEFRHDFNFQMKKDMLLDPEELRQFQNHSSQMAALDFMVSIASNVFIPTYDGNMARVVEGHRRYEYPPSQGGSLSFLKELATVHTQYLWNFMLVLAKCC